MLEVLHNEDGSLKAVMEYLIFNEQGQLNEQGDRVFIGEMEINPQSRGNGVIKGFIKTILNKYPNLKTCVFFREYKYPNRGFRSYTRKQFELLTKE